MEQPVKALVFDAYGTLFDVHSVVAACEACYPGRGQELSRLWRAKQIEYSWLLSLMERYEDFWAVTGRALTFACAALGLPGGPDDRAGLMDAYLRLSLHPDARTALQALIAYPLAILSNGSPAMLQAIVASAGLAGTFTHVVSVDEVRRYKPDPLAYRLAPQRLGVEPHEIGFVSANSWDAQGATAFGFRTFWLNRAGQPLDELGFRPAVTVRDLRGVVEALRTP